MSSTGLRYTVQLKFKYSPNGILINTVISLKFQMYNIIFITLLQLKYVTNLSNLQPNISELFFLLNNINSVGFKLEL